MDGGLRLEEIVTMELLKEEGMGKRAIARTLAVTEGAVRDHLRRRAADGRREKPFKPTAVGAVIESRVRARGEAGSRGTREGYGL